MEKNSVASLLTSVDSLFTTQEERDTATQPRVQEIPIDKIDDFPNHPFKVRMDDNMIEMAESVKQHGILVPAIVRPKENGHYEMVAGHRRKLACTLIAKLQLPCIVRELTDEEATIIMVDSNLQREQLPGEDWQAWKTPGHSPGGMSYLYRGKYLFSGDSLLGNGMELKSIGANQKALAATLESYQALPGDILLFPGHGDPGSLTDYLSKARKYYPWI